MVVKEKNINADPREKYRFIKLKEKLALYSASFKILFSNFCEFLKETEKFIIKSIISFINI